MKMRRRQQQSDPKLIILIIGILIISMMMMLPHTTTHTSSTTSTNNHKNYKNHNSFLVQAFSLLFTIPSPPSSTTTTSSTTSNQNVYNLGLKPVLPSPSTKSKHNNNNNNNNVNHQQPNPINGFTKQDMEYEGNEQWNNIHNKNIIMDDKNNIINEKSEMESLLNITMKHPLDYNKGSTTTAKTGVTKNNKSNNNNNIPKKSTSTKKSSSSSTPNYNIFNMTLIPPQSSSLSSTSINTTAIQEASNDLYTLATTLMTKPPKMKKTKLSSQSSQSSSSKSSSKSLISSNSNINSNAPLTISDLERILNENGYVRRDEISNITSSLMNTEQRRNGRYNSTKSSSSISLSSKESMSTSSSSTSKSKGLAFPQPSLLSTKHVRIGTSISSSIFSILVAISLQPNLWLMGSVVGAIVGNDIAEKEAKMNEIVEMDDTIAIPSVPGGLYGDVCLKVGRRIATMYLKVWDLIQGVWFMYRTGQLSYEYYKTYAALDQKFKIQDKMDAWNARFVEGKKNFDQWERENEIGRKVLAGLRTAWMLEENSYKNQKYRINGRRRSKYRLVQYVIDIGAWFKKFFLAVWNAVTGGGSNELLDVVNGVKIQIRELNLEIVSQRMGAALAALIAVNVVGAMFALAPSLLGILAVASGMIWPNWLGSGYQRIKDLVEETRARGRGEKRKVASGNNNAQFPMIDKNNFNYFVNNDGRKQWYRTGQSMFARYSKSEGKKPTKNFNFFGGKD